MSAPHLFVIAGEPSGDRLGADLMAGLRAQTGDTVRFSGVGGPLMAGQGLRSLVPMDRLSVMGLAEVLPRLPEILRLIRRTGDAVTAAQPDALITIDSPDFCLRVAARARHRLPGLRTIHYVAPSVWAWRPGRAAKMARVIDHVLALLPFEPPYMTAAGMSCDFVGHPVAAVPPVDTADRAALRAHLGVAPDVPLVCLLPGSRAGEVRRHAPLFGEVWQRVSHARPDLRAIIPTVAARADAVSRIFADMPRPPLILDPRRLGDRAEPLKRAAFAEARGALAVSGTVSLELAAAGTPMVVTYLANPISVAIARRLVRVDHISLVNLIEEAPVIPEILFGDATPDRLSAALRQVLENPAARAAQTDRFPAALAKLGRGAAPPGDRAARSVLSVLR
ncbi:MAG: lipid-A-disaccharide synthase [Pseudomonadota bacterium]